MKLSSIKKLDKQEMTLDIEVAETHTYQLSNGMVSHNTNALIMGSASGIHAHHDKPRYFRRVQMNKQDPVYKFFKKHNKHLCEESIWSANKTDDIITFPIEVPENVLCKDDFTAIKHLDIIRMV